MKLKIFQLLNSKAFIKFIYTLIVVNVIALILESYKEIRGSFGDFFEIFEIFSVLIFTLEYLCRIWAADIDKASSWKARWNFITSPLGIIDLIAILPFYLPRLFVFDLRIVRILRLFRLLRILKLGRYSKSLKTIIEVLKDVKSQLTITIFVAFIFLVFSSTIMYFLEKDAQPEEFASIGHSFWWAIATLTTVGYGDVYPITAVGKLLSGIIALIGIGFVALPTGIISSAFIEKVQKEKREAQINCTCPNCGTEFKMKN
ncbi:MAG: voltage-gated potassium channel [Paraglaciecola sp.]